LQKSLTSIPSGHGLNAKADSLPSIILAIRKRYRAMSRLVVFNHVTLDGYFTDKNGDMSWAHVDDEDSEWKAFVEDNARGGGVLLFGRITYELMASYWPTPNAIQNYPIVAKQMNDLPKVVFSRTLDKVSWNNTKLVKSDMVAEIRKMKEESGKDMVILGSGNIVSQLAEEDLIDEYKIVVNPIVLGKGRTMFDDIKKKLSLKLTKTRTFGNGNVLLCYEPMA
jgi:dihydrofolate reductase